MTRKEFEELKVNDWFHLGNAYDFQVINTDESGHKVIEHNLRTERVDYNYWQFGQCEPFKLGRYVEIGQSIKTEQQSTAQEMTLQDALKVGLKIDDIVFVKLKFKGINFDNENVYNLIFTDSIGLTVLFAGQQDIQPMTFEPNNDVPYTPKHNETCAILTKNGFATKAVAIHYKDKISAVSIDKEGNTDYHFKAEQIEKFFHLPPA